jgi:HEAT repeat protein
MSNYDYDDDELPGKPSIDDVLKVLRTGGASAPDETLIVGLSDLVDEDLALLRPVWAGLDVSYRQMVLEVLVDEIDNRYEVNYDTVALMNLNDADARVRRAAVELLAVTGEVNAIEPLIDIVRNDKDITVQAEALRTFGHFLLLGELGKIPLRVVEDVSRLTLRIWEDRGQPPVLRARALEALANTSHADINRFIREAYRSSEDELRIAAIVAMGRTFDADAWGDTILEELRGSSEDALLESVRSAGELQLAESVPVLSRMFTNAERDLQSIIVWALGEIGNKEAGRVLDALAEFAEEQEDDDLLEEIEEALGNTGLGDDASFQL